MGAGKGQNRRTKTVATTVPNKALSDPQKWYRFVQDSNVQSVRVIKYYLGDGIEPYTYGDYKRIAAAIFSDAVEVGAITLPIPYIAEDFEFRTKNEKTLGFDLINGPWTKENTTVTPYFNEKTLMSEKQAITRFLGEITNGVNKVLGIRRWPR